jgi:hypothetical protein
MMDTQLFETAGKIGGVAGLAIAMVTLVLRDTIRQKIFPRLPARDALKVLRLVIVGSVTIGALGIAASAYTTFRTSAPEVVTQQTSGANSPAIANVGGGVVIGVPPADDPQHKAGVEANPTGAKDSSPGSKTTQTTSGACSQAIANVRGDVIVNCGLTKEALFRTANDNLQFCIQELEALYLTHSDYLMPSISEYLQAPDKEKGRKWGEVIEELQSTRERLKAAVRSAIDYDASLGGDVETHMPALHELLREKGESFASLPLSPPDRAFVESWTSDMRNKIEQLATEINRLRERLNSKAAAQVHS